MATNGIAWDSAKRFVVLTHPIPGTSGVLSMKCITTYAEHRAPSLDTSFIAHTKNRKMLVILFMAANGQEECVKRYVRTRGQRYALDALINSRYRSTEVKFAAVKKLIEELEGAPSAT